MADQNSETPRGEPRVIVAQRVVDKMIRGGVLYPEMETGEAMIGFVLPNKTRQEPDIYILDTLSAGEQAVREWGMFELGGDWQGDAFHWLHTNWEAFRELRRASYGSALAAKWDVPLSYVGDWHKQPGAMIEPSAGDLHQARRIIEDRETPEQQLVAPIVTLYPLKQEQAAPGSNGAEGETGDGESATAGPEGAPGAPETEAKSPEIVVDGRSDAERAIVRELDDEGFAVRIDFWYISKRTKRFIRVTPTVVPDDQLPGLPPLSWHLLHTRRFDQEYSLLRQAGYSVDTVRYDADGRPPYEICFSVYKAGSRQVILLVTSVDYPATMPAVRVAPLVPVGEDEDVFDKVYEASRPVLLRELPEWAWDSKRTLIELVWHVEKALAKEAGA